MNLNLFFRIFNHGKSFENAGNTCKALSIDDCESQLLSSFLVPQVAEAIEDPNECPNNLRINVS